MALDFSHIDRLEATLVEIRDSIVPSIRSAISKNKKAMIALQTAQMFDGERSDSTDIEPEYTPFTKSIKRLKNQPFNRVTLLDTGAFYRSIEVEVRSNEFEIKSVTQRSTDLVMKYGDIFGLTDEHLKEFTIKYILPEIKKNIDVIIANS